MKQLVKFFLITSIVVGMLISFKIMMEFWDTRVKKYISVD